MIDIVNFKRFKILINNDQIIISLKRHFNYSIIIQLFILFIYLYFADIGKIFLDIKIKKNIIIKISNFSSSFCNIRLIVYKKIVYEFKNISINIFKTKKYWGIGIEILKKKGKIL